MLAFRDMFGAVYILVNRAAKRIKIGMTINDVTGRLNDVNDKWMGFKGACQICGTRRVSGPAKVMPRHRVSGKYCPGGGHPPIEFDTALAEEFKEKLEREVGQLSGISKSSHVRRISGLERRIALHDSFVPPLGRWEIAVIFHTKRAEHIELTSHKVLSECLDQSAPIGEVFSCSVSKATRVVESVLEDCGLLEAARKEVRDDSVSSEFGSCSMCGGALTCQGKCPSCIQRHFG